jgi:long-chain acyl-CoA synthetase
MSNAGSTRDTFPKLARVNAERLARHVAIREKDLGIWQSYTWRDYFERSRRIALGLASLGFDRGDKTAIVGDNRPELYWAVLATQALGGVPVPLYQDSIEKELTYIVDHAEARFAVAEDQEQVDKLLHVRSQCPRLEFIVYDDARGMRAYSEPGLLSLAELEERGEKFALGRPTYLDDEMARGRGEDTAVICYTSGTTGTPKGAMLSYRNLIEMARIATEREGLRPDDEALAYLPMAWVGDHMLSYAQAIVAGFAINCPESAATVLHDLKEIGPTYFFAPPRIWENLLTNVMIRIEDAAWPKRRLTHFFLDLAQDLERRRLNNQPLPLLPRLLAPLGQLLVYGPLRDNLGLRRIRIAYTAGEVLFRSPGVFQGYFKNPEATRQTVEDGWIHSGDAGFLDSAGHLKIIDRAKDLGRLADGTLFAPKYLENKLKFSPYVKEAVTLGAGRPYVTALVNIDLGAVGNWAERRGIAYTSYTDLSQKPEVYELIQQEVVRVNRSLLEDEVLRGAQIRKFLILHKELDPDDEEITRTRKVRRGYIAQKYATLIEALYGDGDRVAVEAQLTYEDGRTGTIRADVAIREIAQR